MGPTLEMSLIRNSQARIIDVFKSFRDETLAAYGNSGHTYKADNSPLTELDVKIETTLKETLKTEFPQLGFFGEETPPYNQNAAGVWHIDPIDSTLSFIHGLPFCSNMAALIVDDVVVASVLYLFIENNLYTAIKGEGAYKNANRLKIENQSLENSIVFADATSYKNIYPLFEPKNVRFYAPVGATGYFMCRLADNSIQGICYYGARVKTHDIAPGLLLVEEAGGQIENFDTSSPAISSNKLLLGTHSIVDFGKSINPSLSSNEGEIARKTK